MVTGKIDKIARCKLLAELAVQMLGIIEADPERPCIILTETGVGYRLAVPDTE